MYLISISQITHFIWQPMLFIAFTPAYNFISVIRLNVHFCQLTVSSMRTKTISLSVLNYLMNDSTKLSYSKWCFPN